MNHYIQSIVLSVTFFLAFNKVHKAQIVTDYPCYAVSANDQSPNVLYKYNPDNNTWTNLGATGTQQLSAIAIDHNSHIIYAYEQASNSFGILNAANGVFSAIGSSGMGNGDDGTINLNNIKALAYDATNNVMYATHRISGINDLLFQIDVATAKVVAGAMKDGSGNPADYMLIEEIYSFNFQGFKYDVEDIAVHPQTGELYALINQSGFGTLAIIDIAEGATNQFYDTETRNLNSFTFTNSGAWYGSIHSQNDDPVVYISPNSNNLEGGIEQTIFTTNATNFETMDCSYKENVDLSQLNNPIKFKLFSQEILINSDQVKFELIIDSLGQDFSGDGLYSLINTNGNYDIISVNNVHPDLEDDELNVNISENRRTAEITIERKNRFGISKSSPTVSFVCCLPVVDIAATDTLSSCTSFEISGATQIATGNFVPFNDALLDMPTLNCNGLGVDEFQENKTLPLIVSLENESCNNLGAIEIKLLDGSSAPYIVQWESINGISLGTDITHTTTYSIKNLSSNIYKVTVTDSGIGNYLKKTVFNSKVSYIATTVQNSICNQNDCRDYLIVSEVTVNGSYQAKKEISFKGNIGKTENIELKICN